MNIKHLKVVMGVTCLMAAGLLVFSAGSDSDPVDDGKVATGFRHTSDSARNSKAGHAKGASYSDIDAEFDPPQEPRALNLPVLPVDEGKLEVIAREGRAPAVSQRAAIPDDDILTRGGVLAAATKTASAGDKVKGPRSIKSGDWKGAANLLVNALRAGKDFEVDHDQLMDFLRGKDLLGWPESTRNWIGDELMTALRQDMPESAFADLKSIVAVSTAPAAMRDYSVQHISHLMTSGVIGQEGADFIWQTLEQNDPQTQSTALISLHRLSEQVPGLVAAEKVKEAAERLRESPDERTRVTAESILKR